MDEKNCMPHSISMEDRNKLRMTGVTDVGSFDEETLEIYTSMGELIVRGEDLQVVSLSIEKGELSAEGRILSLSYSEIREKRGGFFSRLLS